MERRADEVLGNRESSDGHFNTIWRGILAACRVIAFLEDRRVLYEPSEMEVPSHCIHSVIQIRHRFSDELGKLDSGSELAASLRAMRAACRKFLERVGTDGRDGIHHANGWGFHSWTFGSALGELRGTFGVHVARIAAAFKLDVEDRLASILPANADADTDEDDRLFRKLNL
jgi:hypothetical protein